MGNSSSHSIKMTFVEESVGMIAEVQGPRVPCVGESVALDIVDQKNTNVSSDKEYRERTKGLEYVVLNVLNGYKASYSAMARDDVFEYEVVVIVRRL